MTLRSVIRVVCSALTLLLAAPPARAQAPKGSETLTRQAIADSLKVLDELGTQVKEHPKDAALWYHRAMVAFVLAIRADQRDKIPELDYQRLRIIASDAFLAALNLEPNNVDYKQANSHFRLTDKTRLGRATGRPRVCDTNLEHFDVAPDVAKRVELILEMGWICWEDFDGYEHRASPAFEDPLIPDLRVQAAPPKNNAPRNVIEAVGPFLKYANDHCSGYPIPIRALMSAAYDSVVMTLAAMPFDVAGEADYLRAKKMFEAAYALDPRNHTAYTSLTMLLADQNNWTELQSVGRQQTIVAPDDPWAWMTVALATYRMHPGKEAASMFDSAFARLSDDDRKRLDRLDRVLRPADRARYQKLDSAGRKGAEQTSWMLADPLWSAPGADPRTEFLARVTYAELRWSVESANVRGADTDRGDIYIRYGPPNKILGYQPQDADTVRVGMSGYPSYMHEFWIYNGNLIFNFDKLLHSGRAAFNGCDRALVSRVKDEIPARWDNIATSRIDSMPTQVARFRAGNDSVEMYLATKAPMDAMQTLTIANGHPVARFWLFPFTEAPPFTDSVAIGASGALQWTRRVAAGPYYYRVESTLPGTLVAGRTAAQMMMGADSASGFRLVGFGISDILFATRAVSSTPLHRWSDLDIVPLLGDIGKGAEISLVWENYELGRRGASAQYDVTVTIERERSKAGQIAARIAGIVGLGVNSGKDKVAMKFERTVPYAPVIAENVSLGLRDTPAGSYRLTVQVTDKVSGRVASRTTRILIKE